MLRLIAGRLLIPVEAIAAATSGPVFVGAAHFASRCSMNQKKVCGLRVIMYGC